MSKADSKRIFMGWDRSVLVSAVDLLAGDGSNVDLDDTVVLVPTAEAGRRLRRALAEHADKHGGAVSAPHVWPPHLALSPAVDRQRSASDLETRLVWARVLKAGPPQAFKALLPNLPGVLSWKWLWDLGVALAELQELLGAGGLSAADVAGLGEGLPGFEPARWRDLARMEVLFEAELAKMGKANAQRLKRERAEQPWLPEGVRRVVVLAAPDLPPLMSRWLQGCVEAGIAVAVAVQADEEDAEGFDEWGRPLVARWGESAELNAGLDGAAIKLCQNPVAQAEEVVRWLANSASEGLQVAVGVCDAEVSPLLQEKLQARGLAVFEPGGISVKQDGLWHLLTLTGELLGTGSWRAFCGMMRIPEVRKVWGGTAGMGMVRALDQFNADHLPGSLELAAELLAESQQDWKGLPHAVKDALKWKRRLEAEGFTEVARAWLIALYGERGFQTEAPGDRERVQQAWAWLAEVEGVAAALQRLGLEVTRQETWSLVMERLSGEVLEPARGEVDLVLQGWLELLWENAPALVVAGLNEENVPGVLLGHPFLPDHFRQKLGLPCQATRFARDAYLLTALAGQRRQTGRFAVTLGRWSAREDVLKPSRLLTLCASADLPGRVRLLFPEKEPVDAASAPLKSLLWPLTPEKKPVAVTTISASRIASYLDCPFRYYLKHGLRMQAVGSVGREMDALQFGLLVHDVLKAFGEDDEARQWVHAEKIQKWFKDCLEEQARAKYGRRLPPLVQLQVGAAEQRLCWQAEVEARERQLGWQIMAVELDLGGADNNWPLLIEEARLTGKVDRIEHNTVTGERRVLDFKTSDKKSTPLAAHCKGVKQVEEADQWKVVQIEGEKKIWRWVDVQLPLYAAALRAHPLGPVTQVGYACLPKGVMDTDLAMWEGFDDLWVEAALACATSVVRRVSEGVFWPPNEGKARSQDYDELFPDGVMTAVRWD